MNGPEARTVQVPLSFLGEGPYNGALVRDKKDDAAGVIVEKKTVQAADTLTIELGHGGGFLGRFSKD